MWLSLVERLLWEQDAAGSNPVIRTKKPTLRGRLFRIACRLYANDNPQKE